MSLPQYQFPTPAQLFGIEQEYIRSLAPDASPFLKMFPFKNIEQAKVVWEQLDNYGGMTQIRGYNGSPPRVQAIGSSMFTVDPGVYGEHERIDEAVMTLGREFATANNVVDVTPLVTRTQEKLLGRRLTRVEWIIANLLINGQFAVSNQSGQVLHADSYTQRVFAANVPWSALSTATPLADLRATQLFQAGFSTTFDSGSLILVNRVQANYLLNNANSDDFFGRRQNGLSTINSLGDINELLTKDDLPNIVVYDQGYYDDFRVFHRWIPTGIGLLVGRRNSGAPLGQFFYTRNTVNAAAGGAAGPYTAVENKMSEIPPWMAVHDGFNGGPGIFFPSSIVVMSI